MSGKTYLITGANRGIGKGIVSELLLRSETTVIAAVRNPQDDTSKALDRLPKSENSRLILIKIDSGSETDAQAAAETIQKDLGITRLDVLIANAGISKYYGPAATTPALEVKEHFTVNALGPLLLFQAFWPLLQHSPEPKFVAVSTGAASLTDMGTLPLPVAAYGSSKAALNYIVRKIHFENESLVAFVISPGWVQTEMGNGGAKAVGMEKAPVTLEQSVHGILQKVDGATRQGSGGSFLSFDDTQYAW